MKVLTVVKKAQMRLPSGEAWIKTALIFLISRATVLGGFPFGFACWAASMSHKNTYLGVFAMLLGVFSASGEVLKYALAAGLFLVCTFIKSDKLFDFLFCGMAVIVSGAISIFFNSQSALYISVSILEGILAIIAFVLSKRAENFYKSCKGLSKATQEEIISTVLISGILLTGFSGIYITSNLHLGMLLATYLILCLSRCINVAAAGSVGLTLGFICSMNTHNAVETMALCGIGALLANVLKDFGKIGTAAGFLFGGFICTLYTGEFKNPPISAYEAGIATIMFFVTPGIVFSKIDSLITRATQNPVTGKEMRIKEYLSGELKQISKAFTDLANNFFSISHREDGPMQATDMFDEVADRACKSCPKWGECWIDGFNDMYRHMYDILKIIETDGECKFSKLPIVFKEKCRQPDIFLKEFNHMYEIYKQTAMWRGEVSFGQDMVARQYHEISNLIKGLSEDVELGFSFIESAELKLDSALEKVGFFAKEINVIENIRREPEVYIKAGFSAEPELLETVVSEVMGMPMRLERDTSSMKFVAHNRYCVEYAVCQHSGNSGQVCGDTIIQFETEDNKFCVLLCDGMGLGDMALEESRLTADLFQDFIKAGFIKDTAVKMINSTLAMKAGHESFSTLDLAEIDLRSGAVEFLKVGAAQSYLKRNDIVEIISTKTMPIGILEDIKTPTVSRNLGDGDIIIMVSDGISDTGYGAIKGTWVSRIIQNHDQDMQTLAEEVLKNARKKAYPKPCDDMTVAAMRLKKIAG